MNVIVPALLAYLSAKQVSEPPTHTIVEGDQKYVVICPNPSDNGQTLNALRQYLAAIQQFPIQVSTSESFLQRYLTRRIQEGALHSGQVGLTQSEFGGVDCDGRQYLTYGIEEYTGDECSTITQDRLIQPCSAVQQSLGVETTNLSQLLAREGRPLTLTHKRSLVVEY